MSRTNDFSVLIGLDWASSKHDVCIQYADGTRELVLQSDESFHSKIQVVIFAKNNSKF